MEFTAGDEFENATVPLSELKIKKDVLVSGIVRNGEYIFPSGDTDIRKGDKVIVVTTLKQIGSLTDIFKDGKFKTKRADKDDEL